MQTDIGHLMETLRSYLATAIQSLKTWAAPYLSKLSDLTGLSQDLLFWGIPAALLAFLFLLWLLRRLVASPKKSVRPKVVKKKVKESQGPEMEKPEPAPAPEPVKAPEPEPAGILKNIRSGLSKTRKALSSRVDKLFLGGSGLDEAMLEELEEMLITSDVGVETSIQLIENLSTRSSDIQSAEALKAAIRQEIFSMINIGSSITATSVQKPHVIMVVGVNGVGKTTTIGKLSARLIKEGKKVLIVAADTFRAAASEQLGVWAERTGADIVRHKDNSDPAAVAFDGMEAAMSRDVDVVIIDTAGRLHTKKNLMEELKKIKRTASSKLDGAPHETLMVVDATTGQNALQQAKLFNEAIGISSIALTKLDGTAKGGIVIGICHALNVPLKYIGVGEQLGDLQDFDPKEFAEAMV